MTKYKEAQNKVKEITLERKEKISSIEGIKQEAYNHFCSLFQEGRLDEKVVEFLNPIEASLSMEDNSWMVREVSVEELAEAVWGLAPNKALGLNGFSVSF